MALRFLSPDGTQSYDLRDGVPLIVGRAPTCDLPVFDPTISRRHAELRSEDSTLHLRDLGSSNGTFLNGEKIESATASVDDLVSFGKVGFRLASFRPATPPPPLVIQPQAGATIVRQIPMRDSRAGLEGLAAPTTIPGGMTKAVTIPNALTPIDKSQ